MQYCKKCKHPRSHHHYKLYDHGEDGLVRVFQCARPVIRKAFGGEIHGVCGCPGDGA